MNRRWRIAGAFTTAAPLHVGTGGVTHDSRLTYETDTSQAVACEVAAVVKDYKGVPCLPGTAIKGVLRAWAEHFYAGEGTNLDRVFGPRAIVAESAEAGWAEFCTAFLVAPAGRDFGRHVPYWYAEPIEKCTRALFTGVASNVCIDRHTGAAAKNKLFFQEFVPAGVTFAVEIDATRLNSDAVALLVAILERGSDHPTHPYQFGANGADGWGRVTWQLRGVTTGAAAKSPASAVGFACCTTPAAPLPAAPPPDHVALELTLAFEGPFLVNDQSRAKPSNPAADATNFTPLKYAADKVWLPASSFRGVLRSRAEPLANSLGGRTPSLERLFGHTSKAARVGLTEFAQVGGCDTSRRQDFVAIDRFTGGAADGAKFDAAYADRPAFTTRLTLALDGLEPQDLALFAAALRDVYRGRATFGFGGSKGYGEAKGTLCAAGEEWLRSLRPLAVAAPNRPPVVAPPVVTRLGKLKVTPGQTKGLFSYRLSYDDGDGGIVSVKNVAHTLSEDLRGQLSDGHDVEVVLSAGGVLQSVRRPRAVTPAVAGVAPKLPAGAAADRFANPYSFLRLEDRDEFTGDLADAAPVGHDRYHPGRYSGTIRVRLTAETPLLICDDGADTEVPGHRSYGVRRDAADRPLLASSSVRGMLRAAYEAVTNSRLGVFPFDGAAEGGHARRLGFRPPAKSGIAVLPVRIEAHGGRHVARLLPGTSRTGPDGGPVAGDPVYGACVARYDRHWSLPDADRIRHGVAAWAFVRPWQHQRFRFWNVEAFEFGSVCPPAPPDGRRFRPSRRTAGPSNWGTPHWVRGWICVTERNIDGKHDERFFFDGGAANYGELAAGVADDYGRLIRDYQGIHEEELNRGTTRPPALKEFCRFSRHITHDLRAVTPAERSLTDGTLAYAAVADGVVTALYPVTISRKLYDKTPLDLLPESLRPAAAVAKLSPSDRVFGWVSQNKATAAGGEPAYRSQVRVGPVACVSDDAVEKFDPPQVLAILGQPKPAQGRFYLGDATGREQRAGLSKGQAGYRDGNRVRGPKVYPHHAQGLKQEAWRGHERTRQNRSLTGWVKPGVAFEFDLHVTNLTRVELGGLLWLLSLPAGHFLRLGLGKPLGFGSVNAEVVEAGTCLADGADWADALGTQDATPAGTDRGPLLDEFPAAADAANPDLLAAFRKSAQGFGDLPVRYPRLPSQVPGAGEHFKWFGDNERPGTPRQTPGRKLALPDLTAADPSLPNDPT